MLVELALIIDDYLPHSTRIGAKMFHELGLELLSRGHNVTVIMPDTTLQATYPVGMIDSIKIWRFKSGPLEDVGKAKRAINETLLSFHAWRAFKHLTQHDTFDGIVHYSPSIFWGGLVRKIEQQCQYPSYLVLRDMFPQWAIDAGMLKVGSSVEKYFRYFEKKLYQQADRVGVMSDKNLETFHQTNKDYPCGVLRSWTSMIPVSANDGHRSLRQKYDLKDKAISFYGGNIGHAQDIVNLIRLVRNMMRYRDVHLLSVGQGDGADPIKSLAIEWNLTNLTRLPSVNQEELKLILSGVDVGLFSPSSRHSSHNLSRKLLGYMVQLAPISGSVNGGNDLMDVIDKHRTDFIHVNGEDDRLFKSAQLFLSNSALKEQSSQNVNVLLKFQSSVESTACIIEVRLEAGECVQLMTTFWTNSSALQQILNVYALIIYCTRLTRRRFNVYLLYLSAIIVLNPIGIDYRISGKCLSSCGGDWKFICMSKAVRPKNSLQLETIRE